MCLLYIESELPDQLRRPSQVLFLLCGQGLLVIISEAAESRRGHIAVMVNCPRGCCYSSQLTK